MKIRLNEMSFAELEKLLNSNSKLFHEMKQIADEAFTQWDISDHLRNCPGCIEFDSYGRAYIRAYCGTYNNYKEVIEFCKSWNYDYGIEFDGIEKAERYIAPLIDECYLNIADKDYRYMERFVNDFIHEALKIITDEIKIYDEQFFDVGYLVDALFGNEIIDSSYYIEDGVIYQELEDRIVA